MSGHRRPRRGPRPLRHRTALLMLPLVIVCLLIAALVVAFFLLPELFRVDSTLPTAPPR